METNHYANMLLKVSKENEKESFETVESICRSAIDYMGNNFMKEEKPKEDRVNLTEKQLFKLLKRLDNKKTWGFEDGNLTSFERKKVSGEDGEVYYIDEWCDISGMAIKLKTVRGF